MSLLADRHGSPPETEPPSTSTGAAPPPSSPLARWCVRHRWVVLVLAVVVLLGGGAAASTGILTTPADQQLVGDSRQAVDIQSAAGIGEGMSEQVVVTAPDRLTEAQARALGVELSEAYEGTKGVASVGDPVPGVDGRSVVLPVELAASEDGSTAPLPEKAVLPMLDVTESFAAAHPDHEVGQIGEGSINHEFGETLGEDFRKAEIFSIPLTLIILLIAFGSVVAAGVPLVLGVGSVVSAIGLTALVSNGIMTVDPNAQSLILLIGLAVGVDYALFILRRAREERAAGASVEDSIAIAGGTAGRAVIISGVTVIVAMTGMLVAGGLFASLAIGTIFVVAVAVVASATVLPAVLGVLGDKVDALRLPFSRRRAARAGSRDSFWGRLAGRAARRPLAWTLTAGALLLALAVPSFGMKTALGGVETMPQDLAVIKAYHQLEQAIPSDGTGLQVVVQAPAAEQEDVAEALADAVPVVEGVDHVTGVAPQPRVSDDSTVTVLDMGVGITGSDDRMPGVVDSVRRDVVPLVESAVPGAEVHVGGEAAATDLAAWMDSRLPWVVGFVLTLTFVVMLLSFGSAWLAGATVGLNLLSVGAAYGVMTAVFQGQWAESLLGFDSTGAIAAWLPLLMFVVLFGLSMDYHVFVTSRVREARLDGATPREAVRLGVARSAGVVTSAAAIMIGVFSIFGFMSMLDMKQLGVGLAAAILIDATIVRGVLLPSVLALLGERAHQKLRWVPTFHH